MYFTESLRRRDKLRIFHQKLKELCKWCFLQGQFYICSSVTESFLLDASVTVTAGDA